MADWLDVAILVGKGLDWLLGETCPKCGSSTMFHQYEGETFWTGKVKLRCQSCGNKWVVKN